jgi:hypothetical protein
LSIKIILKNTFGKVREENNSGLYKRISQNISGRNKYNQEISVGVTGLQPGNKTQDIASKKQLNLDICCVVVDIDDDRKGVKEEGIIE